MATSKPAQVIEYGNSNEVSANAKAHEFFAVLLMAAPYAHMLHLQTRSYAEHMALGTFYEELPGLVDSLIESYQGCYGLVMDYPSPKLPGLDNPAAMLMGLKDYIKANRKAVADEPQIQNEIDEIASLVDSTLYKLKFLA